MWLHANSHCNVFWFTREVLKLKLFEAGRRKIDPHCSGKYFCLFFKNYFFPGAEILVVEMCDAGKASAATGEKATLRHCEPPKPSNGHRQVAPSNAFSHKTDTNGLLKGHQPPYKFWNKRNISVWPWIFSKLSEKEFALGFNLFARITVDAVCFLKNSLKVFPKLQRPFSFEAFEKVLKNGQLVQQNDGSEVICERLWKVTFLTTLTLRSKL